MQFLECEFLCFLADLPGGLLAFADAEAAEPCFGCCEHRVLWMVRLAVCGVAGTDGRGGVFYGIWH